MRKFAGHFWKMDSTEKLSRKHWLQELFQIKQLSEVLWIWGLGTLVSFIAPSPLFLVLVGRTLNERPNKGERETQAG